MKATGPGDPARSEALAGGAVWGNGWTGKPGCESKSYTREIIDLMVLAETI